MTTKERIIQVAIEHFNRVGFMNASMRSIATACQITLSNLQYHFKSKELIMEEIFDEMSEFFGGKADFPDSGPDLQILLNMNSMVYDFQKKYFFYFSELSVILQQYAGIRKKNLAIKNKRIKEYEKLFAAYAKAGYFKPEPYPDYFKIQADKLWFLGNFYLMSQLSDGRKFNKKTFEEGNKLSISVVYSLLSEKGITEMLKLMG